MTKPRPKVGIVGEVLIKYHPFGNNFVAELLEKEGAEVILPDFMGFVKFMATHKITFNTLLKTDKTKAKIFKMAIKLIDILERDMKIALGHKGLEWIDVLVEGFKVHGGNKEKGINAIEMASSFIQKIYTEYVPVLNSREYPVLGVPTINVGRIAGGDQPSTVPGECLIQLDRRCVPTETIEQVYRELEEICDELHRQDPRFKAVVRDNFADSTDTLPRIPFCTEAEDPLVTAIQQAMAEAEEGPSWTGELTAFPAWSDAGAISNKTGSHCVVMGPGDLSVAHSIHEYIYVDDVQKAAWIYGLTAINYCR